MKTGVWGRGRQGRDVIFVKNVNDIKISLRASLVAQWLRIRLPMQGTWVCALVGEDPTCHRATKPVRHNC